MHDKQRLSHPVVIPLLEGLRGPLDNERPVDDGDECERPEEAVGDDGIAQRPECPGIDGDEAGECIGRICTAALR